MGEDRWLIVVSAEDLGGTELLLKQSGHRAAEPFKEALVADGILRTQFGVDDVHAEYEGRLPPCPPKTHLLVPGDHRRAGRHPRKPHLGRQGLQTSWLHKTAGLFADAATSQLDVRRATLSRTGCDHGL